MELMDIEIRELKYFITVAKMGTLTRAAEVLFISQPTLTKSIKKLENTIGEQLFDREKNQLKITDVGRELLKKSQPLVRDYEDILRGIADVQKLNSGYVSIGLPPCTIPLLLDKTFLEFKVAYPNVSLLFRENGVDAVIKSLLEGEIDLGIIVQEFPHEDIVEVPLFYGEMVAVLHKEHRLASCKSLDFTQLKGEPLCILQEDYLMAKQTLAKCYEAGFDPNISCTNGNCDFLIKIAQAQKEIAIVPRPIYLENTYDDMIAIPFNIHWPWTICLAWRKDAYMSHATKNLQDRILSQFINHQEIEEITVR